MPSTQTHLAGIPCNPYQNGGICNENPHKTFPIHFTEKEYDRLCKYADKAGLPKTTYIRHMINGCRPKERPGMDYFHFMNEFYRFGNNPNQVTHLAYNFGSLHAVKLEQFYKQYIAMIHIIEDRMIAPYDLDVPATLERRRLLAETEQKKENQFHAKQ